ncbi:MAG TPA: multifunctional CCA tRNA nucleotidyl transferase/2'3'-cyclic phosphodiesterase/2'nucleotidase/phosphatase, partial [Pseudomonas sp.]|nr:multifunctional CCA tRNA nucleotidyl transferase/2'3'-cyclic phosphodiesterase/2'nucleotidase/phosphatase [Pseudomonas sp.]
YLRAAADAARAVEARPLIELGYQGAELGQALKRERLQSIERFKAGAAS